MIKNGFAVVLLIAMISCNSKTTLPDNIIESKKMQQVLWDVLQADKLTDALIKQDSAINYMQANVRLYDSVFAMDNISRTQFENSLQFYTNNPDLFKVILDSINSQQMRKMIYNNNINKNKSKLSPELKP